MPLVRREFVDHHGLPQCVAPQVVQKPIHRCHYVRLAIGEGRPELMTSEIMIMEAVRIHFLHAKQSTCER